MSYAINVLAEGTYEVRGKKQENLTADIRKMAAFVMEHDDVMRKCQEYFLRTYGRGSEAKKHYPLPEQEIHDMMHASLLAQGIDLCPRQTHSSPTPSTDEPIHLEPGSTVCITGTLLHGRKHYEAEIADRGWTFAPRLTKAVDLLVCAEDSAENMSGKVKKAMDFGTRTCTAQQFYDLLKRTPILQQQAQPEPEPEPEPTPQPVAAPAEEPKADITRTSTMVGRRFFPLLILTEDDTQVIVAGNSLYEAICDEHGDIRPMFQELFDSTDAFVDDSLLMNGELDEEAIRMAVSEFMGMVEQAG